MKEMKSVYKEGGGKDLTGRCSPMFVFPLPKSNEGFLSIFCEMKPQEDVCLFTTLGDLQKMGQEAPHILKLEYFTELKDKKGSFYENQITSSQILY